MSLRALVGGLWLGMAMSAASHAAVADVGYVPDDDEQVIEHVGRLPQRKAATPGDLATAVGYATQLIRLGDEEGDPRYFGYAQAALEPWWNLPQPPPEVRLLRATVLQWLHQFDAARRDLDVLIEARAGGVAQARLTRATIELVQGDAASARQDCAALIGHTETLIAATCIATANSQLGRLPASRQSLDAAIQLSPTASLSARRWALTESADMSLRLGQPARADESFRAAVDTMEQEHTRDPYLLAAYSDFLLDAGRPAEVVALLKDLERIDNLLLRLTRAEQALGAPLAQRHTQELERRFAETRQRGDGVHQREEAMFLLMLRHQPQEALTVARDNWQRQRELVDARLLVQCAAAAGRPQDAAAVRDWAGRTGVEDVRL